MNLSANMVFTLLAFILSLIVASFVCDLGQILVARWCGVRTRWRVGYVEAQAKRVIVLAAIVAGGLFANLLLAILLLALTFSQSGGYITAARVDELVPGGVAAAVGFRVGDLITSIDGRRIESFAEMQSVVSASGGRELVFEVERGGAITQLKVTPIQREISDRFGNKLSLGVVGIRRNPSAELQYKRYRPVEYLRVAINDSYRVLCGTLDYPIRMELIPKNEPHAVFVMLGGFLRLIAPYLNLVAVLSVGMGVIKLSLWSALSLYVRARTG